MLIDNSSFFRFLNDTSIQWLILSYIQSSDIPTYHCSSLNDNSLKIIGFPFVDSISFYCNSNVDVRIRSFVYSLSATILTLWKA